MFACDTYAVTSDITISIALLHGNCLSHTKEGSVKQALPQPPELGLVGFHLLVDLNHLITKLLVFGLTA